MPQHRINRINEEVKKELSKVIATLKDPRIPDFITVTNVLVTGDLKFAKAYVSVMGSEQEKNEAIKGLTSAKSFVRKEIGDRLKLRQTPDFTFIIDSGMEHGAKINELLSKINSEN